VPTLPNFLHILSFGFECIQDSERPLQILPSRLPIEAIFEPRKMVAKIDNIKLPLDVTRIVRNH
jgi:hypothetical protein